MTDKTQDLQQLISLSRTMLEKAREESWDDVFVLEAERSELIRLFFLEPVQQAYAEAVAAGIQSMHGDRSGYYGIGSVKKV